MAKWWRERKTGRGAEGWTRMPQETKSFEIMRWTLQKSERKKRNENEKKCEHNETNDEEIVDFAYFSLLFPSCGAFCPLSVWDDLLGYWNLCWAENNRKKNGQIASDVVRTADDSPKAKHSALAPRKVRYGTISPSGCNCTGTSLMHSALGALRHSGVRSTFGRLCGGSLGGGQRAQVQLKVERTCCYISIKPNQLQRETNNKM